MSKYADIERKSKERQAARERTEHERQLAEYQQTVEELTAALDVAGALRDAAKRDRREIAIKPRTGAAGNAAALALLSDVHCEETVRPEQVNGLNAHNLAICEARLDAYFRAILRLVEIERLGVDVDSLVLWLGGDLMSGFIHDDLIESNALSPTQAVLWLYPRISSGIRMLRDKGGFKNGIFIPCSWGNHGRTTPKPRVSSAARNSYEWLLYKVMEQNITDGVTWDVAEGYHLYASVLGSVCRFHHGDGIDYQGGIGGITVPVLKAIAQWEKARHADMDIFGHHHTSLAGKSFISNGSLIGWGPYSLKIKAAYEKPSQTFALIDQKRGRTAVWPVFVQD